MSPMAPTDPSSSAAGLAAVRAQAREVADAGDLTGARTMIEEALTGAARDHGRDHPSLVPLMVDLASIAGELGNLTEAQIQLRRAHEIIVVAAGPDSAKALAVEGRLAAVSHSLGEPTDVHDWHLVEIGARVLGDEHAVVRSAHRRLDIAGGPLPPHVVAAADPSRNPPPIVPEPVVFTPAEPRLVAAEPIDVEPIDVEAVEVDPDYVVSPVHEGVYERRSDQAPPPPGHGDTGSFYQFNPAPHSYQPDYRDTGFSDPDVYDSTVAHESVEPSPVWQRRRGPTVLAISLAVATLTAGAVVAYRVAHPDDGPATRAGTPTAPSSQTTQPPPVVGTPLTTPIVPPATPGGMAAPPAPVKLRDQGGSVTLTWSDPTGGTAPFIVAGGRVGQQSKPLETVDRGTTTSTIYGLNNRFDYCFTVTAVYSTAIIAESPRTCTSRATSANAVRRDTVDRLPMMDSARQRR